jgi:phage-related tail fiber protein
MSYYTKVTASGMSKLAAAGSGGAAVNIVEGAIGDGAGAAVPAPDGTETTLVNELQRYTLNSLYTHPTDPALVIAEIIVPATDGGWSIRELGLFTADGELFAYGNFPETYKPTAAEGSTRDMLISVAVRVGNSANVTLLMDVNVVVATRAWVTETVTAAYLLPGGTEGQVLTKASDQDGDVVWATPADWRPRIFFMGQN